MEPIVPSDVLNIVLLGPNGAGKGTQAQLLSDAFGMRHFVAGELLKREMRRKTALGKKVDRIVSKGALVPDSVIEQLLAQYIRTTPKRVGLVVDGSPRKLSQKRVIDRMLAAAGRKPIALLIDISEKEAVRRLKKRKVCVGCGRRPVGRDLTAAACLACGGHLVTRVDDQPQVVHQRLKVYRSQVVPVIKAYRRDGRLYRVDAERGKMAVYRAIVQQLGELGFHPKREVHP